MGDILSSGRLGSVLQAPQKPTHSLRPASAMTSCRVGRGCQGTGCRSTKDTRRGCRKVLYFGTPSSGRPWAHFCVSGRGGVWYLLPCPADRTRWEGSVRLGRFGDRGQAAGLRGQSHDAGQVLGRAGPHAHGASCSLKEVWPKASWRTSFRRCGAMNAWGLQFAWAPRHWRRNAGRSSLRPPDLWRS